MRKKRKPLQFPSRKKMEIAAVLLLWEFYGSKAAIVSFGSFSFSRPGSYSIVLSPALHQKTVSLPAHRDSIGHIVFG